MSFTCDPYPLIFRSLFVMKSLRLWIVCFAPLLAAAEEFKVIATWPVRAAKDNIPMGFDRASHRLFVGCESGKLAVFDTTNGREVTSLDISAEPDGIHDDAKRHVIYVSCGAGFIDVIRKQDADHYARLEQIPTAKGAATSLFVDELDRLFLAVPAQAGTPAELRIFRPRAPSP